MLYKHSNRVCTFVPPVRDMFGRVHLVAFVFLTKSVGVSACLGAAAPPRAYSFNALSAQFRATTPPPLFPQSHYCAPAVHRHTLGPGFDKSRWASQPCAPDNTSAAWQRNAAVNPHASSTGRLLLEPDVVVSSTGRPLFGALRFGGRATSNSHRSWARAHPWARRQ